jgi:pyrimidine-nucleoside phosphorylase
MDVVAALAAKRDGREIPAAQLRELVLSFAREELPDYQMSAFLMAGYLRGFTAAETAALTDAMLASGERLDLSELAGPTVDKHSTGGVGDGTTLVVAPLAAELGLQIVKLSGRGLGHTGGTLDKLDAIPGMRTELSSRELIDQVQRIGLAVCAQSTELVPADRAMYALRDVTATVGAPALIASSIMSKKLAGGADTILLDVKVGSGAFMHDTHDAFELAQTCVELGTAAGRRTAALISDMNQPLGTQIGNAIEVREAIEVLRGERTGRFTELCLTLTAHLLVLTARAQDLKDARRQAEQALRSGAALDRFRRFVETQGGDPAIVEDLSRLPIASVTCELSASQEGCLESVDTESVGRAAASLGAGRMRKDDQIDPAVGIELCVSLGDQVAGGDPIARVLARDKQTAERAERQLRDALTWSTETVVPPPLIHDTIEPRAPA